MTEGLSSAAVERYTASVLATEEKLLASDEQVSGAGTTVRLMLLRLCCEIANRLVTASAAAVNCIRDAQPVTRVK